ncbi:alpha/beta hydrolase [Acidiferrimicrobium sp. IK]|uniref:alpha/beta fold hydrolase n=1 Tax=Acidiferrimicrobium sp. IK TaxID=2871700 RepID=UPI0021CB1FE1|nr:alpha/beta hydrolase [Acidiferrimicrobium sp. IK]MCU4183497.1 alpha/beta hydrolase [Acidiferrimicrobium sp. IK]
MSSPTPADTGLEGESRWAANGSVSLHYLDRRADRHEPAVLFVPGFGEDAGDYVAMLDAVAPRRALAVDLRGRGRSTVPAAGYRIEDHVADLDAIVADAGLGPVHLVTYSRGTAYGLGWALSGGGRQGGPSARVASITIGDYPPAHLVPPDNLAEIAATRRWRKRVMTDRMPATAIAAMVRDAVAVDWWSEMAACDAPVMVIRAGPGGMVGDEVEAMYRDRIPGVRMVTFADSGHDLWSPDADRFAATLVSWLDELESQQRVAR